MKILCRDPRHAHDEEIERERNRLRKQVDHLRTDLWLITEANRGSFTRLDDVARVFKAISDQAHRGHLSQEGDPACPACIAHHLRIALDGAAL